MEAVAFLNVLWQAHHRPPCKGHQRPPRKGIHSLEKSSFPAVHNAHAPKGYMGATREWALITRKVKIAPCMGAYPEGALTREGRLPGRDACVGDYPLSTFIKYTYICTIQYIFMYTIYLRYKTFENVSVHPL